MSQSLPNLTASSSSDDSSLAVSGRPIDVVVVGATSAGVGAAIAAGRAGAKVLLIEDSPMLGGMLCNGVAMSNIFGPGASSGIFEEFRLRCRQYYQTHLPDDPAVKAFPMVREGYRYEPHVVDRIFRELIRESGSVEVACGRQVIRVLKQGNTVVGVVTSDLQGANLGVFRCAVTIDATHEGDILALAGADFRLGREARSPEERYAGKIYMTHSGEIFGSGEADGKIQAMAMIMTLKDYGPGADKTIPRPPFYDPTRYAPEAMTDTRWFSGCQLPNGKYLANENMDGTDVADDGFEEPDVTRRYILGSRAERRKIWERFRDHTLGYLHFRQTEKGEKRMGLPEDEYPENGHLPYCLYVREGRRLVGEYTFSERDCLRFPGFRRAPGHADSIAVSDWPIDAHAAQRDTEGYFFLDYVDRDRGSRVPPYQDPIRDWSVSTARQAGAVGVSSPIQAPYRVMIPKEIDGLIVPLAVSGTHIGFQVLRLEPIRVALGQAAGNAAARCAQARVQPRRIDVGQLQRALLEQGQALFYFRDVIPSTPHFRAIQRIGMEGVDEGYDDFTYRPDFPASLGDVAKQLFHAFKLPVRMDYTDLWKIMAWIPADHPKGFQHCTPQHWATYYIMTLWNRGACTEDELKTMNPDAPATRRLLAQWAAAALGADASSHPLLRPELDRPDSTLTRGELAAFVVDLARL